MKIKAAPIIKEFPLESDSDGVAKIKVRQVTFDEDAQRDLIFANQSYSWNDKQRGTTTQTVGWTQSQLLMKEIYLSLAGASGFVLNEETGEELFAFKERQGISKFNGSEDEFYKKLGMLDGPTVREIHKYVREVNFHWKGEEPGE